MPLYEFTCGSCGSFQTHPEREPVPNCAKCAKPLIRRYGFYHKPAFQDHFNDSVGHYVNRKVDFEDGLKRRAEEQEKRFNIETTYMPVYPGDHEAVGVTEE